MALKEHTTYTLRCAGHGCIAEAAGGQASQSESWLTEQAEKSGWLRDGEAWYCPKCRVHIDAERRQAQLARHVEGLRRRHALSPDEVQDLLGIDPLTRRPDEQRRETLLRRRPELRPVWEDLQAAGATG